MVALVGTKNQIMVHRLGVDHDELALEPGFRTRATLPGFGRIAAACQLRLGIGTNEDLRTDRRRCKVRFDRIVLRGLILRHAALPLLFRADRHGLQLQ